MFCIRRDIRPGSFPSKRQAELPLFADDADADADDLSQDSHQRRDAATAPSHDGDRSGDSSASCGSSGDGLRRRGSGALRLLRQIQLATLSLPSLQPPAPPQYALTRTRIRKPKHSHGDERAAEPRIGGEGDWRQIGDEGRMRPPPPRARVGNTAEAHGTRRGGRKSYAGGGEELSTASVEPVEGMLQGGELERVRGRVKDLGTAAGGGGELSTASVEPVEGMLQGGELERVRGRVKDLGTAARGGGELSTASVEPVEGMLQGGEQERVRGRVKGLGTAIETSQV